MLDNLLVRSRFLLVSV